MHDADFIGRQRIIFAGVAGRDDVVDAGGGDPVDDAGKLLLLDGAVRAIGRDVDAGNAAERGADLVDAHDACSWCGVAVSPTCGLANCDLSLAALESRLYMLPPRANDMVAHRAFSRVGVATGKGFEDGVMLDERAAALLDVGEQEVARRVIVDALPHQDALQITAAGRGMDSIVERLVQHDELRSFAGLGRETHLGDDIAQGGDLGVRDAGRRHARDHAFERSAGERHLFRLRRIEGDPRATARLGDDQPLVLQPPERLLERRRAHAEVLGHLAFVQQRARGDLAADDRPPQRIVHVLPQALEKRRIDRIQPGACNVLGHRVLLRGLASRRALQCAGLRRTYWDRSATCGLVETPAECFLPCLVRMSSQAWLPNRYAA